MPTIDFECIVMDQRRREVALHDMVDRAVIELLAQAFGTKETEEFLRGVKANQLCVSGVVADYLYKQRNGRTLAQLMDPDKLKAEMDQEEAMRLRHHPDQKES